MIAIKNVRIPIYTLEVAEELSTVVRHLKQIGKVKKLDKWADLMSWQKIFFKKSLFELSPHSVQQQWTISWLDCKVQQKVDFIRQPVVTGSVVGLRSSRALPKAKLAPKKGSWSLFVGLLPIWSTTVFWILVKPLPQRSMLSRSLRCTENCQRLQLALINRMGPIPDCMSHNWCFKSWMNWAAKFCLTHHIHLTSHQPPTIFSSISTTFCRENASTTSKRQKMLSKSWSNPEAQVFSATGINKHFLIAKFVDCNGSYFDW